MYSGFNDIVRGKLIAYSTPKQDNPLDFDNFSHLEYLGSNIPVYFPGEWESDNDPHLRSLVFSNEPDATEVGFSAPENVTGYIQLGIFLPATHGGLDGALAELASKVHTEFQRSSFVDGDFKVEWLNVQKGEPVRIGGHFTITMRVNYRYFHCN